MSEIPSSDAEWAEKIGNMKKQLPKRSLSQPPIPTQINRTIDHTLLATPIDPTQIDTLCKEALEYDLAAVCVRLEHVARAASHVKGTNTGLACVVGFPEGTHPTAEKVREAKEAVAQGANELDMVIRYNLLKEGRYTEVFEDVRAVRNAAPPPIILKAILEASVLDKDQLIDATIVSCMAGADYIKTSTGWNGGASVEHVTQMGLAASMCGCTCLIKASGGIRNAADLLRMLKAGAQRIGTSAGVNIMKEIDEGEVLEQGCSHSVA
ncbi:Deoxyribose-phosphate aldolase/phospho-2-dehydro-3-deoxyheptonate aldolase [Penicillium camemberti]|uniref:deoxyribose-phosphate aldolase n=1 Tax=Penicillium camemberti (strain FM 013) TaxID=1429867 RepID=A0A0G4P2Q8_PENC3|nr:Deoxyribose-phosphate aldolase/phospho-2-dehydro-3-deoxyheptonate aldolase [Penicillium camemberti]